ncbi:glycosyl transferase family 39 [Pirellula staleyi DSM 6068]|uniref:Glycosyl transferase family 39 n=1 Tax=Pirellula staleyi (strain ATCC 27377 / DSM 6068 / ICPB 4128) TaxID=530564 RepID=D2R0E0_PIRSD|nr:phospholipid carrier-dependent glycosyltransferase [Pirellula staleyi]ADB14808.1 glycosyl transferase family 39 [Pirellula staleyi DSM 6068]
MRNILWLLVGLSLLVRGATLYLQRASLDADPDAYRQIAENLRQTGVYSLKHESGSVHPTAFRPPLYPWLIAILAPTDASVTSALFALHLLLGTSTVLLTYGIARKLLASDALAILAAMIVLCDPILLRQQALVMTETLATFLAALLIFVAVQYEATSQNRTRRITLVVLLGILFGLAILCRPTFLPWLALVAMLLLWQLIFGSIAGNSRRQTVAELVLVASTSMLVLCPWVLQNYFQFHRVIVTTTHGGYTLLLGNNEEYYQHLATSTSPVPWKSDRLDAQLRELAEQQTLRREDQRVIMAAVPQQRGEAIMPLEMAMDRHCRDLAIQTMRDNPAGLVRATLHRWWQLISPLPHQLVENESLAAQLARYAVAVWYTCLAGLAIVGLWKLIRDGCYRQFSWLLALLLPLSLLAIHTFYWTNLRMRAPAMPVAALVAVAALSWPSRASVKS